ncbi:type I restriction enzyme HsdR N-terminal domain-containing protein [Candidatus Saccharibacteria bacterium]|nr:type I restriction enzyme HsdR N-terminal domain-containing protein [Candidatus Saccharibacteria bacterium]
MNEKDFECHFREYLQNIFGWYQNDDEIQRQFPIYFGHEKVKYADIVVLVNDKEKVPNIVIELKWKVGLEDNDARVQLFSYMKQLETEFGVLTNGISFQLFYKPLGMRGEPKKVFSTNYLANNVIGVRFGEILTRENYSSEKMRDFCKWAGKENKKLREGIYHFESDIKSQLMEEQMSKPLDDLMMKMTNVYRGWLKSSDSTYIQDQIEAAKWVRKNFFDNSELKIISMLKYRSLVREIPEHLTNLKGGACRTLYTNIFKSENKKKFIRCIELANNTLVEDCFSLIHTLTTNDKYKIKGVGQSFWSEMLRCKFPDTMPLVNSKTIDFFQALDLYVGVEPEEQHRSVYYCYSRWAEMYPRDISLLELSHIEQFALSEDLGKKFMLEELGYSQEGAINEQD